MRRICVFTSTRADYGLLFHLMKSLAQSPDCELHLLVSGTHLSTKHGHSLDLIDKQLFNNIHLLPVDLTSSEAEMTAETLKESARAIRKIKPDIGVILGDRFEGLAFSLAAFMEGTHIVHLHGGEITSGAKDDSYRHCISKLAKLHFTAHEDYRQRLLHMGEQPDSVFTVGAFGLEYLQNFRRKTREELSSEIKIPLQGSILLVTLHSETLSLQNTRMAITGLLQALQQIKDVTVVFTMPNIDPGGELIREGINDFTSKRDYAYAIENMGSDNYLALMAISSAVVGNSSSGIYEAPYLKIPTVNIGDRQAGRIRAKSVIDTKYGADEIKSAILKAMGEKEKLTVNIAYPFGDLNSSDKAKDIILTYNFPQIKIFYEQTL